MNSQFGQFQGQQPNFGQYPRNPNLFIHGHPHNMIHFLSLLL